MAETSTTAAEKPGQTTSKAAAAKAGKPASSTSKTGQDAGVDAPKPAAVARARTSKPAAKRATGTGAKNTGKAVGRTKRAVKATSKAAAPKATVANEATAQPPAVEESAAKQDTAPFPRIELPEEADAKTTLPAPPPAPHRPPAGLDLPVITPEDIEAAKDSELADSSPAGVAPFGSTTSMAPIRITEVRDLYSVIFGITVSIRACFYAGAVAVFFANPNTWATLAIIAGLLVAGRLMARVHSWAWRGYKSHSLRSDDPAVRERVLIEQEQARAEKAARAAAIHVAKQERLKADKAVQIARVQADKTARQAHLKADQASIRAKGEAERAAREAKRIAAEARSKAEQVIANAATIPASDAAESDHPAPANLPAGAEDDFEPDPASPTDGAKTADCSPVPPTVA